MANITIGGDPESYMDPPRIQVGGKGGPSIIASVLDLLGVHKQVAKGPKDSEASAPAQQSETPAQPAPLVELPALDAAESAFQPMTPMPADWGRRYLDSLKPLETIDPDSAF